MIRLITLSLAFFFSSALIWAQFNVIPQPDQWNIGKSQFLINEQTVIVTNQNARAEAEFLAQSLMAASGKVFQIVDMNSMPQENFILLSASNRPT